MRSLLALCVVLLSAAVPARSADAYRVGSLEITRPWARATPKGAAVAGGYMRVRNNGTTADRLVGGAMDFAGRFEIHSMTMTQGVMRMRELKQGLEIKPGESVEFKPGSLHVMFVDLKQPLVKGQPVKATLLFEKAGRVEVEFPVEAIGGQPSAQGHGATH